MRERLKAQFSVLGIDIYRYSEYPELEQVLIPLLFDELYDQTCRIIIQNFTFIFQPYIDHSFQLTRSKMKEYFIGTGDGGYQIFETPLHATLFVIVFEAIVRLYNTRHFMTKVFDLVGPITFRYVVTYDTLYHHGTSYFGAAIINNSRILSKDHLNRLIVDDKTYDWFQISCLGIENLSTISLKEISELRDFTSYSDKFLTADANELIYLESKVVRSEGIKFVTVQKLGPLESKRSMINVYNVSIQTRARYSHFLQGKELEFTYSVGNMNPQGLVRTEK